MIWNDGSEWVSKSMMMMMMPGLSHGSYPLGLALMDHLIMMMMILTISFG